MIEFVLGKTGSGKSLFSTEEFVVKELLNENTYIISNLPLNMGEINAYFQRHWPTKDVNCMERVRVLNDREARRFYLHREVGVDFAEPSKAELADPDFGWLQPIVAAANASKNRLIYVIDEAHIFFDAREWAHVSGAMNTILSQHRHIGIDRIVFVTQFLDQVEKRLRLHAVNFYECQNWGMKRISMFKLPKIFTITVTSKPPPYPADYKFKRKHDPEIMKLYDTTAGVGMTGGRPPEVKKVKGISVWWFFAAALVVALVLAVGPEMGLRAYWKSIGATPDKPSPRVEGVTPDRLGVRPDSAAAVGVVPSVGAVTSPEQGPHVPAIPESTPPPAVSMPIVREKPQIWVTGYATLGDKMRLQLSDGSVITREDLVRDMANLKAGHYHGGVSYIGRTFIEMSDGTRYHFRPPERKEPVAEKEVLTKDGKSAGMKEHGEEVSSTATLAGDSATSEITNPNKEIKK